MIENYRKALRECQSEYEDLKEMIEKIERKEDRLSSGFRIQLFSYETCDYITTIEASFTSSNDDCFEKDIEEFIGQVAEGRGDFLHYRLAQLADSIELYEGFIAAWEEKKK